jgi:SAM-dependent methyltransferase
MLADWQLPPGVDRGLWDYLNDTGLAARYDAGLAGSTLFEADLPFVACHCPTPGRLIDLGCGTGRLLTYMARRGWWVLGVDLSESMLRQATERATREGLGVNLLRANLAELSLVPDTFDAAACLFSTLGMIRGAEARRKVVKQAFRLLKPGGKLLLHVHNRWFNVWDPHGRRWLIRNTLASTFGRVVAGDRLMPVHQGIANLTLHLYTRREVCRLLRGVGFRVLEVRPIGLGRDATLARKWLFPRLRAYGYLIAAVKES